VSCRARRASCFRLKLACLIVDHHWPVVRAAERYDVSWPTAKRWADRYREQGEAGMIDLSSRPHSSPSRTPQPILRKIVHLRWRQRLGPVEIGYRVGRAPSTVHAVLVRCRINRLSHIDRVTGEPTRRYEHPYPGSMIHVDVKKLGNVPDGGGWRYVGRQQGAQNRQSTPNKPRTSWHGPKLGHAYVHTVLDDYSRVAYAEIHDDETKETAAAVLRRATAWFTDRGVTVERVLSDNGGCYKSFLWRDTCAELGILHKRTRPYRPQTNGKNREVPPDPGRGLGLQEVLPNRDRPQESNAKMDPRVQPPPAPHRSRQVNAHQPLDQPLRSVHLATGTSTQAFDQGGAPLDRHLVHRTGGKR
jgi:transposase InsO family protein